MGYLTGDEVKALLAEPDPATRRGLRDTVLLSMLYDTAARVQEICDLNTADVRTARPIVVTLRGKGSKTRRVPLMDPTARLVQDYLDRRAPHLGVGADADPLFNGPEHTRLTRWGVTKILARHVQSLRRRDPGYAAGAERHPARDQKDPGDAPAPSQGQPDLHPRPARPRRRINHRDLRPRRRGSETQSHRERLPVAHPRALAQTGRQTKISSNGSTTSADNAPGYVAGTGPNGAPSSGNTPAGHITQPST